MSLHATYHAYTHVHARQVGLFLRGGSCGGIGGGFRAGVVTVSVVIVVFVAICCCVCSGVIYIVGFGAIGVSARCEADELRVFETLANRGEEEVERGYDGLLKVYGVYYFFRESFL